MKFENPFKLQNWKFKKFLLVIISIQLSLLGLFALNDLGVNTQVLRPLIGFIYLSFVPGYLLLRILKLHNLSSIESFLYALGLSLFIEMLVGFLMNMFYPILGITNNPISEIPIVLTMAGVVFLLCILSYLRDKEYNNPDYIDLKDILNSQVLFLSLIPFMAIFGTYLVNYYHTNILLMIMIIVIALVALIIGFTNWIDEKYYPYAIWVIAIALVWHIMLITPYVNNHDGEMWGAKITIENGFWNYNDYGNYNSILSNKIFTPIVYFICGISLTWIYKAAFPLWISIFPVVIYSVVKRYLDYKIAFLSALVVMVSGGMAYVNTFTVITKQFMAEFFISLMVLAMCDKLSKFKKIPLIMLMFGISVVWSHYGTSYLFMIGLIFTVIFLKVYMLIVNNSNEYNNSKEFLSFTAIYVLLILSWYMYVSDSSLFNSIVGVGNSVFSSIWTEFLSPDTSRGAYILAKQVSGLRLITKYMNLGIVFFITLGIFKTLWNYKKLKLDPLYLGLSLYFLGILVASVVLPYFAVMSPDRIYLVSLITLSPFCVLGGVFFFRMILTKIFKKTSDTDNHLKIFYIYIVLIMLFNTGFIQEIIHDRPTSMALSQNSVDKYGTLDDRGFVYGRLITEYDMYAVKWISKYDKKNSNIYCSGARSSVVIIRKNYGDRSLKGYGLDKNTKYVKENSYIWVMYANLKKNVGFGVIPEVEIPYYFNFSEVKPLLKNKNKIYDNGGSQNLLS